MADIQIVDVLGFPVANVDMAETVAAAAALLEPRANAEQAPGAIDASGSDATAADRSAACGARIVTANAEILYHSYSDPALGELLRGADLLVPDGIGVVKAAAMLGSPVKERVAGADLLVELSAWAADNGRSVYLLGASPESVEGAASALQEKYPALSIAGYHDGYFNEEEREDVLRDIQDKRPDFLFIGMGFPAQDIFFAKHQDRLPVGLMVGVGGTFDALSGRVRRAPLWIRKLNLEWAYRFAQNPRRLGRFWALPRFLLAVRRQRNSLTSRPS